MEINSPVKPIVTDGAAGARPGAAETATVGAEPVAMRSRVGVRLALLCLLASCSGCEFYRQGTYYNGPEDPRWFPSGHVDWRDYGIPPG